MTFINILRELLQKKKYKEEKCKMKGLSVWEVLQHPLIKNICILSIKEIINIYQFTKKLFIDIHFSNIYCLKEIKSIVKHLHLI